MADINEVVLSESKRYVEEIPLTEAKQIHAALFHVDDISTSTSIRIDKLTLEPYAAAYTDENMESVVREFQGGTGIELEPPITREKTPLSQKLLDKVAVGIDVTGGYQENEAQIIRTNAKDHLSGHNMTKNKQSIDVFLTGEFNALGVNGEELGLGYDYQRKPALTAIGYDFTAVGANTFEALGSVQDLLISEGMPMDGFTAIVGSNWRNFMSSDPLITEAMKANSVNQLVEQSLAAPIWKGVKGLTQYMYLKGGEMQAPATVLSYQPGTNYRAKKGEAAVPWIGPNDAIFFSTEEDRFFVQRGVLAFDAQGKVVRVVGSLIMDTFHKDDPIVTNQRSQSRHIFACANINHTASSTGTFA